MPTKRLHIPTADGQADAFAAFPDGGGRHPGVLMYSDGFGIRPVLREMARNLAGHGQVDVRDRAVRPPAAVSWCSVASPGAPELWKATPSWTVIRKVFPAQVRSLRVPDPQNRPFPALPARSNAHSDSGHPARRGTGFAISRPGSDAVRVPASLVISSIMAM